MDGARALIFMGQLDEALERIDTSLRLLRGNDPLTEVSIMAFKTLALLHRNQLDAAVEAADTAYALVSKTRPTFYEMFRAYASPVEVYLEVWARARQHDPDEAARMRRAVHALLRKLRFYVSRAPNLSPIPLRLAGLAHCLNGNPRRGTNLLRQAAAQASRLGLPLEEGIALYELARHAADPRERGECRDRAQAIFLAIGCELYLRKMSEATN